MIMMAIDVSKYQKQFTSSAPLALFRILFGLLILFSTLRFWLNGWIEELYLLPKYHFPYYGFEFVSPIGNYTYLIFIVCGLSAIFFALGWFYRLASILLFLSFTYIELMDKSAYLNHYYFVSIVLFMMIFLPAQAFFSVDAQKKGGNSFETTPIWCTDSIKLMICIVYFYAGIAKLNSEWLLLAQPLKIWLPARNEIPLIGFLFNYPQTPFLFSWFGCIYDLLIPFLLWNRKTTYWAFVAVVIFHLMTSLLFPIGVFPYVMITSAFIFFPEKFHLDVFSKLSHIFKYNAVSLPKYQLKSPFSEIIPVFIGGFLIFQLVLPFRYWLYPGELFWTEQGYRFSWRVMLMEKSGYLQMQVKDQTGKFIIVNNSQFLTPLQEKMVATQPDMILQYAHILRKYYATQGFQNLQVFADAYVTLNGRRGEPLIDLNTDLGKEEESWKAKNWILPFSGHIQGF